MDDRGERTCQRNVEALGVLLANLVDGLDILVVDLDFLEVGRDAAGSDRLGDHTVATGLGPRQDDLCAGGLVLLGDLGDGGVVDEQGLAEAVVACLSGERLAVVALVVLVTDSQGAHLPKAL